MALKSPVRPAAAAPPSPATDPASETLAPPVSPYNPQFVQPSPVESHGTASTDATEIDDVAQDKDLDPSPSTTAAQKDEPASPGALRRIETNLDSQAYDDPESGNRSVIHVSQAFGEFTAARERSARNSTTSPAQESENTVISPQSPRASGLGDGAKSPAASMINTDLPSSRPLALERPTPQAQTRQEAEEEFRRRSIKRSKAESMNLRQSGDTPGLWSTWLADIPEGQDAATAAAATATAAANAEALPGDAQSPSSRPVSTSDDKLAHIVSLKTALTECWTLCNTLATLSSKHRKHVFHAKTSRTNLQETAWQSCWKLCQNLYDSRDDNHTDHILPTLEMCREFCQALFEARRKDDELADSVLRVSFELNNHLYNTHDRNLPLAFQERTLDFYLTLCHRLMKQKTSLPEETDALLRSCWNLAEMLFSMRQNNRDGKPADEETLSTAIQACWELCDLFREGWTQVRPERGTPKPSQQSFTATFRSGSAMSNRSSPSMTRHAASFQDDALKAAPPETPTTIFDDMNDESMDDDHVPNILVLGPDKSISSSSSKHKRWPSSASNLSGYSDATSARTYNSTGTSSSSQTHLNRIRVLLVRAAGVAGFTPRGYSPPTSKSGSPTSTGTRQTTALLTFVKTMPQDAFGSQPWQLALVPSYRKCISAWPDLVRHTGAGGDLGDGNLLPDAAGRRMTAAEIARAVMWMMRSEQHAWMRELFRVVFGAWPDDTASLTSITVTG